MKKVLSSSVASPWLQTVGLVFGMALAACTPAKDAKDPAAETTGGAKGNSAGLIGKAAPEVQADYVAGDGPKSLAEAKGQVAIVDFWGTFCEPCKKSFPKLQDMVDTQAGKLVVIAVSQDDPEETKAEDIKKFADELKVSFPLLWDKQKKTAGVYSPPKMPTSYIIDKKGVVRFVHGGYTEGEAAEAAKEVEKPVGE